MKSNMLITGGAGLLALNWAQLMRGQFNIYLVLHKRNVKLSGTTASHFQLSSIEEIQENFEYLKPQVVVHTAGLTSIEACESNPELANHINVNLAENMAKVCEKLNIPLVHISTDHLFSGTEQNVDEGHPIAPQNIYAKTKAEAEIRVLDSYPDALVVRTNFFGYGPTYRASFSDMIINKLSEKSKLTLFQDVFYTPVFSGVLVQAVHDLVRAKVSGIFNVVGDERLSKYEFGMKLAESYGLDKSYILKGDFLNQSNLVRRPSDMSLSNEKVCKVLGRKMGSVEEQLKMLHQQYETGYAREIQVL